MAEDINGLPGLRERVARLEERMDTLEEFMAEVKRFGFVIIVMLLGTLGTSIAGLILR